MKESSDEKPAVDQSSRLCPTKFIQDLEILEEIIFDLNEDNISESINSTITLINNDEDISSYSNIILSRIIYSSILSQMKDFNLYINFMKQIENKENNHELIDTFRDFLLDIDSQESYFILEKMIEMNLVSAKSVENKNTFYFAHHFPSKPINILQQYNVYESSSYEKLSKNDFELHKKLIKEGVNPNEIAKIIRNDEIEKLQEISSRENFNFNQYIMPSLYERCSYINEKKFL